MALKVVCFTNLVVCKFKRNEFQSVIAITDQILEMDTNHAKALWFRGRSYLQVEEYDNAIATLVRLCKVEPQAEFKRELDRAK